MSIGRRQLVKLGFALAGVPVATALQRSASASERRGDGDSPTVKPVRPADPGTMEDWWGDLEKGEPEASRALLKLAGRPVDAVAFLKGKMKPLTLGAERLDELLTKLGSADENEWRPAFEELEYFDPRLAVDLETLMVAVVDTPKRQRMVAVMSGRPAAGLEGKQVDLRKVGDTGHNFQSKPGGSWWAEVEVSLINSTPTRNPKSKWTRAVRAIALLEHIGTPEAIAVLRDMSGGHPLAQPTRVAKEALERIGGKS